MRFRISVGRHTTSQDGPEMQKALLALLHTRIPAILVANVVNSSLVLLLFIDTVARAAAIVWYALIILTVACFGALWFRYRDHNAAAWSRRWRSSVFICHGVGGLLWGAAGVLFFMPQSVIHFTVLAFVLGGMAAGALATLSIHLPTFHVYVLPSLLPFCVRLAAEGGTANLVMAAMFLMYIVAIVGVAPQTHDAIAQTFALRFENRALLLGLEQRVRDRTRRHASVVDFSQRALSGLETDKVLEEAAALVAKGLPATCAAVMELLPERDVLAVRATAGWKGDVFVRAEVSAKPETVSGHALLTGEPAVSNDPGSDTRLELHPELGDREIVSTIAIPILGKRGYYGTLEAWSTEPWAIADDDVHFARAVATTIAAALQRRRSEELAQRLALHDPLTGLPNRSLFRDYLSQALNRARRAGALVALLLVDLDHFKDVNDSLGHPAGDLLLEEVARRLRACIRKGDPPARLGGDEFGVILSDLRHLDGAAAVAAKILATLALPFDVDGHNFNIGASIGIAVYPIDGEDPDTLLRNADLGLYRAKERGRNSYEFYSADLTADVEMRMELLRDLRMAIEGNQMELAYQPQIDLRDGRVTAVEALLRWRSPRRGTVPPGKFIPIAEASGLIIPLGDWTIRQACVESQQWRQGSLSVLTAVNLSLAQWRRTNIVETIEGTLQDCECDPHCLELEITERVFPIPDETNFLEGISYLRQLGVTISIDDFGTGHSNLGRLLELPVDRIKIDRSFVAGIGRSGNAEKITRSIIVLARSLGATVVAEGVEQASQVAFLQSEGCDFAQGFYFAPPMSAEDLMTWISEAHVKSVLSSCC